MLKYAISLVSQLSVGKDNIAPQTNMHIL